MVACCKNSNAFMINLNTSHITTFSTTITPGFMKLVGNDLLALINYNNLIFWNIKTNSLYYLGLYHTNPVAGLEIVNDTYAVSGSSAGFIALWNIKEKSHLYHEDVHDGTLSAFKYLKNVLYNGNLVFASGSSDMSIKFWQITPSRYYLIQSRLNAHTSTIRSLELIDENTLASGSDNSIILWCLPSLSMVRSLPSERVFTLKILSSGYLLSSTYLNNLNVWNIVNATQIIGTYPLTSRVNAIDQLPDTRVVLGFSGGIIKFGENGNTLYNDPAADIYSVQVLIG